MAMFYTTLWIKPADFQITTFGVVRFFSGSQSLTLEKLSAETIAEIRVAVESRKEPIMIMYNGTRLTIKQLDCDNMSFIDIKYSNLSDPYIA